QNRLPTIFGNTCPLESGQSLVASPASWLVTNAPAMIKKNVAQATRMANRFRPLLINLLPICDCQLPIWTLPNRQSAIDNRKCLVPHWNFECGHHLQRRTDRRSRGAEREVGFR